ncbi:hypothetical protein [Photorhabdus stackebrandtii]|nr:hypothetical protein [Photorhabdus stackebrandtii]
MMKEYSALDAKRDTDHNTNDITDSKIGSGNNKSTYQVGKYNPKFWNNDKEVLFKNNCYAYACNICVDANDVDVPDPGYRVYANKPNRLDKKVSSLEELKEGIAHDGLVEINSGLAIQGTSTQPMWRVALFAGLTGNNRSTDRYFGYHFFREVYSKDPCFHNSNFNPNSDPNSISNYICWAHKFFKEEVTNLTHKERNYNPRHVITDPEIEMDALNEKHNVGFKLVGYYLVTSNVKISTP